MSISITVKYKEMTDNDEDNDDESDKHLEARDCRYSCLILASNKRTSNIEPNRAFTRFTKLLVEQTRTSIFEQ